MVKRTILIGRKRLSKAMLPLFLLHVRILHDVWYKKINKNE
jgi:hypothetical protein